MNLVVWFSLLILCLLPLSINAAYPQDQIFLPGFNQSFYLKNETYKFQLFPAFNVPLQILRHTVYTASQNSVVSIGKRAIMENSRDLYEVSPEDYEHLHRIMGGDVPEVVRVNKKKRSLPPLSYEGTKVIRLSPKVAIFHSATSSIESKKRDNSAISQSTPSTCIHIPFITTCDNTPDISSVKTALQASVDEIHSELDSYEKTNNARMNSLSTTLNTQRGIIDNMLTGISELNILVGTVASSVQVNAAQIADGDYQAHSQINFLKRTTKTLLSFANALASTDPRTVAAQPSLSKLFSGYMTTLSYFANTYIPIVDSRVFDWQETILPAQSIQNTSTNPCLADDICSVPVYMSLNAPVTVFSVILNMECTTTNNNYPTVPSCISPAKVVLEPNLQSPNWIYGPFHQDHYGIYPVTVSLSSSTSESAYVIQPIIQPSTLFSNNGKPSIAFSVGGNTLCYCVQFLGYTMLASVPSTGNNLLNGISPTIVDPSNCDAYRLLEGSVDSSLYSLYAESEGVIIPFYSNCDIPQLVSELTTLLGTSVPSTVSTINYVCSNAWSSGLASNCGTGSKLSGSQKISNVDVYLQNWLSPNCYINVEPSWIDVDYYVNPPLANITNIPRGYLMNQFTINPDGELASSLEFVYTTEWAQTYVMRRISQNTLITDEITLLEGAPVLFRMNSSQVVDESDSFFGEGNNGRDCIHQSATYDYNLLECFFQNNNQAYTANQYLTGLVTTTGIARYVTLFDFQLYFSGGIYYFTLVPQDDAEFSFSVQHSECPQLNDQESELDGCFVSLFYTGTYPVKLVGNTTTINMVFTNFSANATIGFDTWSVEADGLTCFFLDCHATSEYSLIRLVTPPYQLISASDLALQNEVSFSIAKTINYTLQSMQDVLESVQQANQNISELHARLDSINFNVTSLFPYQNLTGMRQKLQNIINNINSPTAEPSLPCSAGAWSSATCWFENFAGALIAVGLVVVGLAVGYFVCVKGEFMKKVLGKKDPPLKMAVYSAD